MNLLCMNCKHEINVICRFFFSVFEQHLQHYNNVTYVTQGNKYVQFERLFSLIGGFCLTFDDLNLMY